LTPPARTSGRTTTPESADARRVAETFTLEPVDNRALANLCGPLDANLRQIEAALVVTIARRGASFNVTGERRQAALGVRALQRFYGEAEKPLSVEDIQLGLVEIAHATPDADPLSASGEREQRRRAPPSIGQTERRRREGAMSLPAAGESLRDAEQLTGEGSYVEGGPILRTRRADLHGRTPNQVAYLDAIRTHDICFGIGPAGTGKTYLAVACAVDALERDAVKRIVLVRPAVEAGERLGFLPGDLAQKVDPYLRPLFDALYDLMGFDKVARLLERQTIELAPLAYMRGRTLNHSFIILDEAQNTTPEQMKMFLTRIGFGTRAVITGDVTQIDLARGQKSGLIEAARILKGVRGISFVRFTSADVVRHPLVQKIIDAYDRDASA
jgi:phosphate starvation-inducible PhoH-like protein